MRNFQCVGNLFSLSMVGVFDTVVHGT